MAKMRNIIKSTAEYTETFSNFRGISPEGDRSNHSRLAYCENVYRDYEGENAGAIESIPGYRLIQQFSFGIYGIYNFQSCTIVHSGAMLYQVEYGTDPSQTAIYGLISVKSNDSHAFTFGQYLYFLDGESLIRVSVDYSSGLCTAERLTDFYVPITYLNGKAYEARNLLTDSVAECFDIVDARDYAKESDGLRYSITDGASFLCSVSGADEGVSGDVCIPGYKTIGGVRYQVYEIADSAFYGCSAITSVTIGEGVKRIGKMAFYKCTGLTKVVTPHSLLEIEDAAFNACNTLSEIYLRSGLAYIGPAAFTAAYGISGVHYEGSEEEFQGIDGYSELAAYTKVYYSVDNSLHAEFKLASGMESVTGVTVDGESVEYTLTLKDDAPASVELYLPNHWQHNGTRLTVAGVLPELMSDFNGTSGVGSISGRRVIQKCLISELFDGRIFLAGNPELPSTVFYASRTRDGEVSPLYFGEMNYFRDGTDAAPVTSLLSVRSTLAVFKSKDDGMGGIFYHKGENTGDDLLPRIYPVTDIHSGIRCVGGTLSYRDEAFFISSTGLNAIERQSVSLERGITERSGNISTRLSESSLKGSSLLLWMGYIAMCCGSTIYLADPRSAFIGKNGTVEYEWFIINGIGHRIGIKTVYRYSGEASAPTLTVMTDKVGEICTDVVYSRNYNGLTVFFTRKDGLAYEVYPTDATTYDSLMAAKKYASVGNNLLFSVGGFLYIFNNDMRGILPSGVGLSYKDFHSYAKRIHPSYYSFAGYTPRYIIRTVKTDCGIPHLTKSSVKDSLVVKLGPTAVGDIVCEVGTDKNGHRECAVLMSDGLDFSTLDFSSLSLAPEAERSMVVHEKEKGWVDKDVTLYTNDTLGPIVVYGIAFRYKIKGRIKKS